MRRVFPRHEALLSTQELQAAVTGWRAGPEAIGALEQGLGDWLGAGGTVLATSSARGALAAGLKALELPAGSRVLLPSYNYYIAPMVLRHAGLEPLFADVDESTGHLDPVDAARALDQARGGPPVSAMLIPQLFGACAALTPLLALAEEHGLAVIEDVAQSLGARWAGDPVGGFGDAAIFSFRVAKPVTGFGGGALWLREPKRLPVAVAALGPRRPRRAWSKELAWGLVAPIATHPRVFQATAWPLLRLQALAAQVDGLLEEDLAPPPPGPIGGPIDPWQAAVAVSSLPSLTARCARRRALGDRIVDGLRAGGGTPGLAPLRVPGDCEPTHLHLFVRLDDASLRPRLQRALLRVGLDSQIDDNSACHRLPVFAETARDCPISAGLPERLLELPSGPTMSDEEADGVVARVRAAANGLDG